MHILVPDLLSLRGGWSDRVIGGEVTMGNPLYIRETLDQLLQDGNLKVGENDWREVELLFFGLLGVSMIFARVCF